MLMMVGLFHILVGTAGVVDDEVYAVAKDYIIEIDAASWGWR